MMKKTAKKNGITLLENIIAILLIGIVITAILLSLITARMYAVSARHHYQAICLAREEIEKVLAGETPYEGTVTIDSATGLTGTISVSNPTLQTTEVSVIWTERMWANISMKETIVARSI